jgi:hypothetical protein
MNRMNKSQRDDNDERLVQPIDYIAKCDSDTLLFPEIFLDQLLEHLPSHPQNAYFAGLPFSYLMGGCYFLSWELFNYVAALDGNHTKL